jgi:2-polyprenyl-3-methyl-5-hydroxy-6-metoxy-1,4-benzoquinol methylase
MSEKLPLQIIHPDPAFRYSDSASQCAFNLAYNTPVPYFGVGGWLALDPDEAFKFGRGMGALGAVSDPGVAADFPWAELAKGKDAVVDVGGGQGTLACALAEKYPSIKAFVVQDLEELRDMAGSYIKGRGLEDRVVFEAQDFFEPQQRRGKYIFVIQRVLHDWNLEDAARILRQIKDAMNEDVGGSSWRPL